MIELDLSGIRTVDLEQLDRIASLAGAKYADDALVSACFAAIREAFVADYRRRSRRIVWRSPATVVLPLDGDGDPAVIADGLHRLAGVLAAIRDGQAPTDPGQHVFGSLAADVATLRDARRLEVRALGDKLLA